MNKKVIILIAIISTLLIVRINFVDIIKVSGDSMNPTLENNQFLLLNKHNKKYERFDIIVFKKKNITYIKRVIGLPTEKVEYKGNKLYINDEIIEENFEHYYTKDILFNAENKFVIPDNAYIVLGDNRIDSIDSRSFGIVNEKEIIGKVILK